MCGTLGFNFKADFLYDQIRILLERNRSLHLADEPKHNGDGWPGPECEDNPLPHIPKDGTLPNSNVKPGMQIPVIMNTNPVQVRMARWGMIAAGMPDISTANKYSTFNARLDTIMERVTFRDSFLYKHCLIPITHFIEWAEGNDGDPNKDQPYCVRRRDQSIMFCAGIWNIWKDPTGKLSPIYNTALITINPNETLLNLPHHRMPVIFETKNLACDWIKFQYHPYDPDIEKLKLKPLHCSYMEAFPISKSLANFGKNTGENVIDPLPNGRLIRIEGTK